MSAGRLGVLLAFATAASAHVGSPDVFFQGKAGPYPLLVAIRPPDVIPGVAHIEVRAQSPDVRQVELTPTPMTGEAAKHPPTADAAARSATDPSYFEGALWLMSVGSWEVRVRVSGDLGAGELRVPVPAIALQTKAMDRTTGYLLFGMMVFLSVGLVAIVAASVREAKLEPGVEIARWNRRNMTSVAIASAIIVLALWYGNRWWGEDEVLYKQRLYKPLGIIAEINNASRLDLQLKDPGWLPLRRLDDLAPDHGHLMHFFLIRWPDMDQVFHLHPDQTAAGNFGTSLPSLPAGRYKMFADIVHESGFAETAIGEIDLPDIKGQPLTGDDAGGAAPGSPMEWLRDKSKPIIAKQVTLFSFTLNAPLEPYMGMGGHAEFVKRDGSVFAHVHPSGSVPMASVAVASPETMMAMHEQDIGTVVSFPYGLPSPGQYRVFVQLKRNGKIETGAFDLTAE